MCLRKLFYFFGPHPPGPQPPGPQQPEPALLINSTRASLFVAPSNLPMAFPGGTTKTVTASAVSDRDFEIGQRRWIPSCPQVEGNDLGRAGKPRVSLEIANALHRGIVGFCLVVLDAHEHEFAVLERLHHFLRAGGGEGIQELLFLELGWKAAGNGTVGGHRHDQGIGARLRSNLSTTAFSDGSVMFTATD